MASSGAASSPVSCVDRLAPSQASATCLADPSDVDVLEAWGIPTTLEAGDREFDVLVIGAGPTGLVPVHEGMAVDV
jgi:hypothetical protein